MFLHRLVGKRVIGMPGDWVVKDPSNVSSVGGAPVEGIVDGKGRKEPMMVQVPEGHVWVVGDNMGWSRDSRFYGPMPMAFIRGKMLLSIEGPFAWKFFKDDQMTKVAD